MSVCMIHTSNKTNRPAQPAAMQGLFAVGYEPSGSNS